MKPTPIPSPYNSSAPFPFASTSRIPPLDSPHVHFPPTPIMTKTATTHSRAMYDRRPIVVSPNVCELPERGERDLGDGDEGVAEESYFQLESPKMARARASPVFSETSQTFANTQDPPSMAPSESNSQRSSSRTRCHSHPDPLIRLPTAFNDNDNPAPATRVSHRPLLRRHTDPYPGSNSNPLGISQVPSLVSDHSSSDSDSDDPCLSPPLLQLQSISGVAEQPHGDGKGREEGMSHISLHFPGGLSTMPFPAANEADSSICTTKEAKLRPKRPNAGLKRRWNARRHFQGQFEDAVDDAHQYLYGFCQVEDSVGFNIMSGVDGQVVSSSDPHGHEDPCGFVGFYDRELEGCLGGF
ncbi:hypothetical protein CVT26_004778 [Gymnopilus dilepis]|uniref:Uncharacterized protein n=1 Tax=Gymnopilus dilepis TaxID=231916 RepID=A0A409XZE2_9AGAR|nr:hypothetical protein CVT26_004778 [Gymnopilus dilepis]